MALGWCCEYGRACPALRYFCCQHLFTIRWAIACGKPVVKYDVYRYRFTDFIGIERAITFEEQDEFVSVLRKLATDPVFASEMRQKQEALAPVWGRLDGKSGQPMAQLVWRLLPEQAHQ